MTTFLGIPIRYKGRAVGSIYLTDKEGGSPFTAEDEEIVRLFANQAAVAIQNAQLYEQVQALAVETERTRISREMHDGLAQVLSYVNTKAQAIEALLDNEDISSARAQLKELSQAAREVYGDVREGILALRTQAGGERSFADAMAAYISEYSHQLGPSTKVDRHIPDDLNLTPLQEVQVLRIVQEALTNARKHAPAGHVSVTLSQGAQGLEIEVRDDGDGFNPLAIRRGEWPHLGLQTMQERTEAIGGTFAIESTPGSGTRVRVTVPHPPSFRTDRSEP